MQLLFERRKDSGRWDLTLSAINQPFHGILDVTDDTLADVVVVVGAVLVQLHLGQEGARTNRAHDLMITIWMVLQKMP